MREKSRLQNQTYKDLKTLFRLFIGSLFIVGGLNYIFDELIENLDQQTRQLQIKKSIEERVDYDVVTAKDDFAQLVLLNSIENSTFLKDKIDERLKILQETLTVLKLGGMLTEEHGFFQTIYFQPSSYNNQYDNFSRLTYHSMQNDLQHLKSDLTLFYANTQIDQKKAQDILFKFQTIKDTNTNLLRQTSYQINKYASEIALQKEKYTGYELLAMIFVISSLLYLTHVISTQILKTNAKLEISNTKAKEMAVKSKMASKTKSEFLANMSHEIRTPLNAILGFIDLLREKEENPEKLKYIQTIQSSSNTLLGIINDILDFSKIESGNLNIETIDFNTNEELSSLADLFRAKASEKSVSLTFKMDPNLPKALKSDPLRIKQVMANLLSNAIKFTPRNGRIELIMKYRNENLFVSVKDNGIGIAEDKQQDIFKAFSQAESSTTRKFGGTGLGLAISSKLVSMLGGELKLESRLNEGSRFYFEIPVSIGEYKQHRGIEETNTDSIKGKRILLVEDNKANQMFMSLILKKFGVIFDIANDGVEAVTAYKEGFYDLILMDENMPNLNGIEATKQILSSAA